MAMFVVKSIVIQINRHGYGFINHNGALLTELLEDGWYSLLVEPGSAGVVAWSSLYSPNLEKRD